MRPFSIQVNGRFEASGDCLFQSLDTTLPEAKWTCLLGPSGSGKSTLLRLLLGLPTHGSFIGEMNASDAQAIAPRASYMAQTDLLLPWLTVRDNVALGARLRGETVVSGKVDDLLQRVGLQHHQLKRPSALSGGMRQRAALARTLMEDRPFVLLDEPFSSLDAGTRADMQELAVQVLVGRTVLLVTHDPSEAARLGHQILLLSEQRLQAWPAPETVPIRELDAPETIACQSALLRSLRKK